MSAGLSHAGGKPGSNYWIDSWMRRSSTVSELFKTNEVVLFLNLFPFLQICDFVVEEGSKKNSDLNVVKAGN